MGANHMWRLRERTESKIHLSFLVWTRGWAEPPFTDLEDRGEKLGTH